MNIIEIYIDYGAFESLRLILSNYLVYTILLIVK